MDALKPVAVGALGWLWQWTLFGPKKVPAWVAWGVLVGSSAAVYALMTPTVATDFATNWREGVASFVMFMLAAKGAGSSAKALGIAPATNSL